MNTDTQTSTGASSGKRGLVITLLIFLVPFASAAFLHVTGLYKEMGTSNRGVLIIPPVPVAELGLKDPSTQASVNLEGKWHILYPLPDHCADACRNTLMVIHQIRTALGPEADRVGLVAVLPEGELPGDVTIAADIQRLSGTDVPRQIAARAQSTLSPEGKPAQASVSEPGNAGSADRIYLIDTMGMIFMYHDTHADERTAVLKGKDLLRDLQHALKLSKIG